jgi:hypothetical protein
MFNINGYWKKREHSSAENVVSSPPHAVMFNWSLVLKEEKFLAPQQANIP